MKIGLTGGIGCGKSTVVRLFAEAGWRTIESDTVVREFLAGSGEVRSALRERWADVVFSDSGEVDRKAIAKIVFNDESELQWLENLLHPLVRAAWQEALFAEPESNWLVEIPLLFEKRLETEFDLTVCVTSPPDVVEARMVRRGYTGTEVEQRRSRQMPLLDKALRADHIISNAGSLEFLKRQTRRLISEIRS
ncbi:MAG: dephospho-CoA kinase [Opitutales bacterium]|nr:dephospho-CoA kinase [Opitutales bacterium]